jgi:hypothetical protein
MNTYRPYASSRYRKANYPYFNDPPWPPGSAVKQQTVVKPPVKPAEGEEGEKLPPNPWLPAANSRPPPPKSLQTLMGGVKQPPTPAMGQLNVPLTASGQYKGRPLTSIGQQPKLPPSMKEALKQPPAPWDGPPKEPLTQMSWQQQQQQLQQQQQQFLLQQNPPKWPPPPTSSKQQQTKWWQPKWPPPVDPQQALSKG